MRSWKPAAVLFAATLAIAACNGDEGLVDEASAADEPAVEDVDEGDTDAVGEEDGAQAADGADDQDGAGEAGADQEQATFDPDDTIPLIEVAASPMGSDSPEYPFGDLPEGIEFDIPAAHTVSIWEEPEGGEWLVVGRNQAGFVQVNLPGAEIDDVIDFIEAETADKGWEPTDDEALYTKVVPLPDGAIDSDSDGEWFADTELRFIANDTPQTFLNVRVTIRPFVR